MKSADLKEVINEINDPIILGSGIFSKLAKLTERQRR